MATIRAMGAHRSLSQEVDLHRLAQWLYFGTVTFLALATF